MVWLVYSKTQRTSCNIAEALKAQRGFEEAGARGGMRVFSSGNDHMLETEAEIVDVDVSSIVGNDITVFLSKHSSAKGIGAYTVHAMGNWSDEALLGGTPKSLSTAEPAGMLSVLSAMGKENAGLRFEYEATHHGPLTSAPSFFAELGGNEDIIENVRLAETLARSIGRFLDVENAEFGKVAIGIGGTHYPERFTRLALAGSYAFGHIMPKYNIHEDMLRQAVERSNPRAEVAVIEWKSIGADQRARVIRELDSLGVDYERV